MHWRTERRTIFVIHSADALEPVAFDSVDNGNSTLIGGILLDQGGWLRSNAIRANRQPFRLKAL
jgi:hypothetical protein